MIWRGRDKMNICCIGAGYIGGPAMALIAMKCPDFQVSVVDVDAARVAAWASGPLPYFEPGLDDLINKVLDRNLSFSTDLASGIRQADIVFIAVDTPTRTYGRGAGRAVDLRFVETAARAIAEHSQRGAIVVEKSTVPIKTAEIISSILAANARDLPFRVVSNPEFLAEGTAIRDLLNPDRILIGGEKTPAGQNAVQMLAGIYARWVPRERIITTDLWSAELSKLVANAFLAQRVSSINSISAICDVTGADVDEVADAIGRDSRIGDKFLRASVGFGSGSLRRDVLSLVYICENLGLDDVAAYWMNVVRINEWQHHRFASRIVQELFGNLAGKKIAILGFAFKENTSDTRGSSTIAISRELLDEQAALSVYDPKVPADVIMSAISAGHHNALLLSIAPSAYDACDNAHAVVVLTEWKEFNTLDYDKIYTGMKKPAFLFDGRNALDLSALRTIGFRAFGLGKPVQPSHA